MKLIFKKVIIILIVSLSLITGLSLNECNAVNDNSEVIYIIGNNDLNEVEKYNRISKEYTGILPEFFKRIKEKRGINLEYLNNRKSREKNINNKQAEIISGISMNENINVKDKIKVLSLSNGNDVYIGFTDIADENLKNVIMEELNNLTIQDKENIIFAALKNQKMIASKQRKTQYIIWVSIGLVILFVVSIIVGFYIKKLKRKLSKEKYIDKVTGFSNYDNFEKSYSKFLTGKVKTQYCLLDLGINLEIVEKVYGYDEVERVLKEIATSINEVIKDNEMFCRKTSDSFLILVKYFSKNQVLETINLICDKIKDSNVKYDLDLKFGIYSLKSTDTLDIAVYNALQARKTCENTNNLYNISTKKLVNDLQEEYNLQKNIVDAVENQNFTGYIQPIIDPTNNKKIAIEILARLENEKLGFIKPSKFLKYITQSKKEYQLDLIMFRKMCNLIDSLNNKENKDEYKDLLFVCNFSSYSLLKANQILSFKKILEEYEIDASRVIISIKYNVNDDNEALKEEVLKLKESGFKFMISEFNGDINTFNDIINMNCDYVKFSASLFNNLNNLNNQMVVKNIVDLLKKLNIKTVCTEVNDKKIEKLIKDFNFDLLQGNKYYQSMPIDELEKII